MFIVQQDTRRTSNHKEQFYIYIYIRAQAAVACENYDRVLKRLMRRYGKANPEEEERTAETGYKSPYKGTYTKGGISRGIGRMNIDKF